MSLVIDNISNLKATNSRDSSALIRIWEHFLESTGMFIQHEFLLTFPREQVTVLKYLQSVISSASSLAMQDPSEFQQYIAKDIIFREYLLKLNEEYIQNIDIKETNYPLSTMHIEDQKIFMSSLILFKMLAKYNHIILTKPIVTESDFGNVNLYPYINQKYFIEHRNYLNKVMKCFDVDISHFTYIKILSDFYVIASNFIDYGMYMTPSSNQESKGNTITNTVNCTHADIANLDSSLRKLTKEINDRKNDKSLKFTTSLLKQIELLHRGMHMHELDILITQANDLFFKKSISSQGFDELVRKFISIEVFLGVALSFNHKLSMSFRCIVLAKDICWAISRSSTEEYKILKDKLLHELSQSNVSMYITALQTWIEYLSQHNTADPSVWIVKSYQPLLDLFDRERDVTSIVSYKSTFSQKRYSGLSFDINEVYKTMNTIIEKASEDQTIKLWLENYSITSMKWASFYDGAVRKYSAIQCDKLHKYQGQLLHLIQQCYGPITSAKLQHLIGLSSLNNREDRNDYAEDNNKDDLIQRIPLSIVAYSLFQKCLNYIITSIGDHGYITSVASLPDNDLFPVYIRITQTTFKTLKEMIHKLPLISSTAEQLEQLYITIIGNILELSYPETFRGKNGIRQTPDFVTTCLKLGDISSSAAREKGKDMNYQDVVDSMNELLLINDHVTDELQGYLKKWIDNHSTIQTSSDFDQSLEKSQSDFTKDILINYYHNHHILSSHAQRDDFLLCRFVIDSWTSLRYPRKYVRSVLESTTTYDQVTDLLSRYRNLVQTCLPYHRIERHYIDMLYQSQQWFAMSQMTNYITTAYNKHENYGLMLDQNEMNDIKTRDEDIHALFEEYQSYFHRLHVLHPSKAFLSGIISLYLSTSSQSPSISPLISYLYGKTSKNKEYESYSRKFMSSYRSILVKALEYIKNVYNLDLSIRKLLKSIQIPSFVLPDHVKDINEYIHETNLIINPIETFLEPSPLANSLFPETLPSDIPTGEATASIDSNMRSEDSSVATAGGNDLDNQSLGSKLSIPPISIPSTKSTGLSSSASATPIRKSNNREEILIKSDLIDRLRHIQVEINPNKSFSEEYHQLPGNIYLSTKKDLIDYLKLLNDIHDDIYMVAKGLSVDHLSLKSSQLTAAIPMALRGYLYGYSLMSTNYLLKKLNESVMKSFQYLQSRMLPFEESSKRSINYVSPISNYELKSPLLTTFNHLTFDKAESLLSMYSSLDLLFECRLINQTKSYIYFELILLNESNIFQRFTQSSTEFYQRRISESSISSYPSFQSQNDDPEMALMVPKKILKPCPGVVVTKETIDVEIMAKFGHILQALIKEEFLIFPSSCDVSSRDHRPIKSSQEGQSMPSNRKHRYSSHKCIYCQDINQMSKIVYSNQTQKFLDSFIPIQYYEPSTNEPFNEGQGHGLSLSHESNDPCEQLLELLSLFQIPCDVAALTYFTQYMRYKNGLILLKDMSSSSSPHNRMLVSYVYASLHICYRQVMERYCYYRLFNNQKHYRFPKSQRQEIEACDTSKRDIDQSRTESMLLPLNRSDSFVLSNNSDLNLSIDHHEMKENDVNQSIDQSLELSSSESPGLVVHNRFPFPKKYHEYFANAMTYSSRNRSFYNKLLQEQYGYRLHVSHPILFAIDVRPGSLRFSRYSTFHRYSRLYQWKWHDEELYLEINQNLDVSTCHGRIDISLYFIQSYWSLSNVIDKLKLMNVLDHVHQDLLRMAKWILNIRYLIYTETWQELEEQLSHYKRNQSYYYSSNDIEYIQWLHIGPMKLYKLANDIFHHHHSIYVLDTHINITPPYEKKLSNGLFFKFIDFDLLGDALRAAIKCSIQSDELRRKIALCKFIYDLNISTMNGYWVEDYNYTANITANGSNNANQSGSTSINGSNPSYVYTALTSPIRRTSINASTSTAASATASTSVSSQSKSMTSNRPEKSKPPAPLSKSLSFASIDYEPSTSSTVCIIPSVASLLKICNSFTLIGLSENDEKNIPISMSVFPTLIQSEIQNVEKEFQNQQIEGNVHNSLV